MLKVDVFQKLLKQVMCT